MMIIIVVIKVLKDYVHDITNCGYLYQIDNDKCASIQKVITNTKNEMANQRRGRPQKVESTILN